MILTILVGGVSALFSFGGYVLAAPDLQAIVSGEDADPIPAILECDARPRRREDLPRRRDHRLPVVRAEPAGRREPPAVLVRPRRHDPRPPLAVEGLGHEQGADQRADRRLHHAGPDRRARLAATPTCSYPVTAFAVLGIYVAFQMVVLAALRQRFKRLEARRSVLPRRVGLRRERRRPRLRHVRDGAARDARARRATSSPTGSC